jgi:preprotein translocase subunit SecA
MLEQFRVAEDMPIESEMVVQALDKVQTQVEAYFSANRAQVFRLDDVVASQRKAIYEQRRVILTSTDEDIGKTFRKFALQTMDDIQLAAVVAAPGSKTRKPTEVSQIPANALVDATKLVAKAVQFFPSLKLTVSDVTECSMSLLQGLLHSRLNEALDGKAALLNEASQWAFPSMARYLSLLQMDESWCKHLSRLDILKEEMVLSSFSPQGDIMMTYREKADALFGTILDDVRRNTVYSLFIYDPSKPRPGGR